MADRDITAVLKLKDELSAKIQKSNKELKVINKQLGKVQKGLGIVGKNTAFKNIAKSIFTAQLAMKAFSVAVRGVAAAFRASMDFETSMTKLITLVGLSTEEVKELEGSVKALGGATGRSPRELAESLFFIESAGLRGKDALDALEFSAKAAAIGMGETRDIADALTSAMNAYGPSVLTAQQATDTMLAAVRAGKMEPRELASALGQVLPVASEMGVSFQEVNAALAALSKTGTSVTMGVSQIRSAMMAFLKPGEKAAKILAEYGLSAKMIREQIREKGLIATLISLREKFRGNEEQLARVIGRVEGLNAVLALTGGHAEDTKDVLDQVTKSAGLVGEGFDEVSKTARQQFNTSLVELETIGIEIAANVLPPIVEALKEFNSVLKDLTPETKAWVVQMGLLAIALGKVVPWLIKLSKFTIARGAVAAAGGPAAIIAGALIVATALETKLKSLQSVQERMSKMDKGIVGTILPSPDDQAGVIGFLKSFKTGLEDTGGAAGDMGDDIDDANKPTKELLDKFKMLADMAPGFAKGFGSSFVSINKALLGIVPGVQDVRDEFDGWLKTTPTLTSELGRTLINFVPQMRQVGESTKEATEEIDHFGEILQQSQNLVIIFGQSIGGLVGSLAGAASGFKSLFGKGLSGFKDMFKGETGFDFSSIIGGFAKALPAIGALAGPAIALFGKIFKPKWKKLAEESAKIFGQALSEGLSKELLKTAKNLGSIENAYAAQIGDIVSEVGVNAQNVSKILSSFNQMIGMVENGTLDWAEATEQVSKAFPELVEHLETLGTKGDIAIGKLVSRMRDLGEVSAEVQDFIKEKAQSAISHLSKYFGFLIEQENLTGEQAKNAVTVMAGAFEAAVAATGSLSGAMGMLGEDFGTLLGKMRETLGENNALLNTMSRFYNFVKNNEEQLAAIEGLGAAFGELAQLGIVNRDSINEYAAAFKDQFDAILGKAKDQGAALAAIGPQIGTLLEAYRELGVQVPGWLSEMAEKAKEAGASLQPPEGLPDILKDIRDIMLSIADALGAASGKAKDLGRSLGSIRAPDLGDLNRRGRGLEFEGAQEGMFKKLKKDTLILAHAGEFAAILPKNMKFVSARRGLYEDFTKAGPRGGGGGTTTPPPPLPPIGDGGAPIIGGEAPVTQGEMQQSIATAIKEIVAAVSKPEISVESSPQINVQLPELTAARAQEIAQDIIIPETKRALRMNIQGLRDEIQEIAKHG